MQASIPASFRRLLFIAGLLPAATAAFAQTGVAPEKLDTYVVTATRSATGVTTLGTNVDLITAADLARQQIGNLRDALGGVAGAPAFSTGATGGMTSLFLRGANSNQTLFLVDGIRFNDPNTEYSASLGGMCVGGCDNLEVAHGPQSTLYGGEAVGGVVSLRAQRGAGPGTQTVSLEAGSFGTVQGAVSAQAGDERSAYSFSAAGGHTDNERANNDFDSATYTLRLDRKVNDAVAIGATWRGFNGIYGSPGAAIGYGANDPDNEERESNQLATIFAEFKHSPVLSSRATLGGQDRRYVSESPDPFGNTVTVIRNRRAVLDWQTAWQPGERHRVTGGFTTEANHTRNNGFGDIDESQTLFAFFAQDEFSPVENVFLTAGLRSDDFDTFGRATTGKASAAWRLADNRLKFRASYGTGFRSPSFLDLYGRNAYYVGNPDLKAEKARGWDAGADYYLPGNRGTLSVTWFEMNYDNLIAYDFNVFPSTVRNVEEARTRGLECSGKFTLPGAVEVRLAYTYLEADNLTQHTRLLRRPRHSGSLDLWRSFGAFSLGGTCSVVAGREDVDAETYATIDGEDYAVARVYAAWQLNRHFTFKARVENALDEKYAQVHGYPQPGAAAYAGVEYRF
jgi:vitamin B12 transporter